MKKYSVILHPDAEADINSWYQWGRKVWGDKQAKAWAQELQLAVKLRLTSLPLGCPLAPESDDLGIEVRQLIVRRYRVLFIVDKKTATILHVRDAYGAGLDSREAVHDWPGDRAEIVRAAHPRTGSSRGYSVTTLRSHPRACNRPTSRAVIQVSLRC
jgi:plasmid stabilization system protein ParE